MLTLTRPTTREYFIITNEGGRTRQQQIFHTIFRGIKGPLCGTNMSGIRAVQVASAWPEPICRRCMKRLAFLELELPQYADLYRIKVRAYDTNC